MGWQDEFELKDALVMRDMYPFEQTLTDLSGTRGGLSHNAAHLLKASIAAGWVEGVSVEVGEFDGQPRYFLGGADIDDMEPGKVMWYGSQVAARYAKAIEIPPN